MLANDLCNPGVIHRAPMTSAVCISGQKPASVVFDAAVNVVRDHFLTLPTDASGLVCGMLRESINVRNRGGLLIVITPAVSAPRLIR